jgi:hypothetical protein
MPITRRMVGGRGDGTLFRSDRSYQRYRNALISRRSSQSPVESHNVGQMAIGDCFCRGLSGDRPAGPAKPFVDWAKLGHKFDPRVQNPLAVHLECVIHRCGAVAHDGPIGRQRRKPYRSTGPARNTIGKWGHVVDPSPKSCQPDVDVNQIRGHGASPWPGRRGPAIPSL